MTSVQIASGCTPRTPSLRLIGKWTRTLINTQRVIETIGNPNPIDSIWFWMPRFTDREGFLWGRFSIPLQICKVFENSLVRRKEKGEVLWTI